MGRFVYDSTVSVDIEDRTLAHIQCVVATKLRRSESFSFTWREDAASGDGRTSVWVHPAASLVFCYAGSRPPQLSAAWVEALTFAANSASGLHLVAEPSGQVGR